MVRPGDEITPDQKAQEHHRHGRDHAGGHDHAPLNLDRLHQLGGRHRQGLGAARADDRGEQEVVPAEEHAEHDEGADPRRHQRDDQPERLPAGAAVALRRFLDRVRDVVEEALQNPDGEGKVEGGVGEDQAGQGADQSRRAEDHVERHHDRHHRRHARRDDPEEQVALAPELGAGERVGRHRAERDGDRRGAQRRDQAVAQVGAEVLLGKELDVVRAGRLEVEHHAEVAPVADFRQLERVQQVLE